MSIWLERFLITALAAIAVAILLYNPLAFAQTVQWSVIVGVVVLSFGVAVLIERIRSRRNAVEEQDRFGEGAGGRGGGGNAVGKGSRVVGGAGGKGGAFGRGGDGGGGDARGEGALVVGGDGGDAGRFDGRGGRGGQSPLKKVPAERLAAFGLAGNEGYGQGGSAPHSPEYDRRLRVLCRLSTEFDSTFPDAAMHSMPGVLMPPQSWVNTKLEELGETFRVELIDNATDFLLHDRE